VINGSNSARRIAAITIYLQGLGQRDLLDLAR
jgi:hypothetical protein